MRTHIRTLLAVILLAGCPSGDDDDTSNDDDVTANDDDIANDDDATGEEVWGEVFLGAPDDFTKPSTAPAGTQVSELGANNVTETNAQGRFSITPAGESSFELFAEFEPETYVSALVAMTWEQWAAASFVELELEERSHNAYHYAYEYGGQPYSPGHGTLVVEFGGPDGDDPTPVGVGVSINLDHGGSYAILGVGQGIEASVLPDNAEPEIDFARVEPGVAEISLTLPVGLSQCIGPDSVTVRADTITFVAYYCQ